MQPLESSDRDSVIKEPLVSLFRRPQSSIYRTTLLAVSALAGTSAFVLCLRYLFVPLLVFLLPGLDIYFFDWALYGTYPDQSYVSFGLSAPCARTVQWDESCGSGLVLLGLSGPSVSHSGPLILDAKGDLVWTSNKFGVTMNLKVQDYCGQEYLTFWAGEKLQESGRGMYFMLDSAYNVVHTVSAVGEDLYGDLHEFKITADGTALMTVYNRTNADLADTGMALINDASIVDGIVQEVDIATSKLIFQWRASDHLDSVYLATSYGDYVNSGAFDYFHVNSIDKDLQGNYLISLRHLHMFVYIDGTNGDILWALGGMSDDFLDISSGMASDFQWQHDVRWIDRERGIISLFNNGMARKHYDADHSEGRIIQLDFEKRTVQLLQSYMSPQGISSASQGSVQMLPPHEDGDAHVFVGWGSSAAYSEFTSDGELLCETHFAASSLFYFERAKSYRAIKAPAHWKAEAAGWDPSARIHGGTIYVSWNGATEVAWWALQGMLANSTSGSDTQKHEVWEDADLVIKESFETSIELPSSDGTYIAYRVAAFNSEMKLLRYSNVERVSATQYWRYFWPAFISAVVFGLIIALLARYRTSLEQRWPSFSDGRQRIAYQGVG